MFDYVLAFEHFVKGVQDGLNLGDPVEYFTRFPKLRSLFYKCFVLNGFIFVGSILLFDYALPYILYIIQTLISVQQDETPTDSGSYFYFLFHFLKLAFWIIPIYSLSFILSTFWYNDIARSAFKVQALKRTRSTAGSLPTPASTAPQDMNFRKVLIERITQEVYRIPLFGFFQVQILLLSFTPYPFNSILSFVYTSWLYAFYAFEYSWGFYDEMRFLQTRLEYFERHWAYMFGFGAPSALLSFLTPSFMSAGIWALMFPFFIVLGIRSKPPKVGTSLPSLPIFYLAKQTTAFVVKIGL